jgi:hypothetical protein
MSITKGPANSGDYTDVIIPVDYTLSAFKYINRKQYHNWKMIGMQVSHGTVGGIKLDENNHTSYVGGIVTGCMPIEEINQNNQIIGRGAYYFRGKAGPFDQAKSSAAYGILGHCNTPGVEWNNPSDVRISIDPDIVLGRPGPWQIEGSDALAIAQLGEQGELIGGEPITTMKDTPWFRGWGVSQGYDKCSTMNALSWHLGYWMQNTQTGFVTPGYIPDVDCIRQCGVDNKPCIRRCREQNAQARGRFSPWGYIGTNDQLIYRNCEAMTYDFEIIGHGVDGRPERVNSACLSVNSPAFNYNDILGVKGPQFAPLSLGEGGGSHMGIMIKLTSLPTCNHFDKLIQQDDKRPSKIKDPTYCVKIGSDPFTSTRYPLTIYSDCGESENGGKGIGLTGVFVRNLRCERAVLRIASICNFAFPSSNEVGLVYHRGFTVNKAYEYHYDRWDRADDGNYKLFDEIIDLPDANLKIRVLAASTSIWDGYMKPNRRVGDKADGPFLWSQMGDPSITFGVDETNHLNGDLMRKKFLTGGGIHDVPGGKKGCMCQNPQDGDEGYNPIRPYNEFVYCPNNFTCEKTCNG